MSVPVPAPPPPTRAGRRLVVPVDIERLAASVRLDAGERVARVRAAVDFSVDGPDGYPAFDLRQDIEGAVLDGQPLAREALAHEDLGAGHDARMRVLDVACDAGSRHRLELTYRMGTPDCAGALPLGWSEAGDGVTWDLWMSDLEAGRYLEMWLPAGLCHDRLAIELDVEVAGTDRPHTLLANGEVSPLGAEVSPLGATAPWGNGGASSPTASARWAVRYPATYTSLSPMLVLSPSDEVVTEQSSVTVGGGQLSLTMAAQVGAGTDLPALTADAASWLAGFYRRYGPWAHGDRFVGLAWASQRGMEYDGATTASPEALEHEVFHSWFGRGVKPASANDGWVDEAMATWATASSRSGLARWASEPLGLDEEPILLCPAHPWSRHTPRAAYPGGARLLSGLAHMAGGAAVLRSALADWHGRYGGGMASTADLARHLGQWCGRDLSPWWDRYVYGGEQGR